MEFRSSRKHGELTGSGGLLKHRPGLRNPR
jgi:hypothetical protein